MDAHHDGGMVVAGADDDVAADSSAAAEHGGLPSGGGGGGGDGDGGGGWRESADAAKEASDNVVTFLGGFVARHGWTVVLLVLVWYNCKDSVKRRYRQWQNKRSLADANRPDRRAVLDRERARSVAGKQAESLEAARALAAQKSEQKIQSYAETTARLKDD